MPTVTELPSVIAVCALCGAQMPQHTPHECAASKLFRQREASRIAQQKATEARDAAALAAAVQSRPFPEWDSREKREYERLQAQIFEEAQEAGKRQACERCGKFPRSASDPVTDDTYLQTHGQAHVCIKPLDPAEQKAREESARQAAAHNPLFGLVQELQQRLADLEAGK